MILLNHCSKKVAAKIANPSLQIATAKTYNLVGLAASAFAVTEGGTDISANAFTGNVNLNGTYNLTVTGTDSITVVSSADGKIKAEASNSALKDLQFGSDPKASNGMPDNLNTVNLEDIKNYIKFNVDGAGSITVTSSVGSSSSAADEDSCVGAIYDSDGNLIGKTDAIAAKSGGTANITGSVDGATDVYIVFFRSAAKGSFRVTKIEVAAQN